LCGIGEQEAIRVYNLESGDLIHELHDEGARMINSLTVAGEGCGVKPEFEIGDVGVDKVAWLATGHEDGRVRICDLQTERCANALLHPAVDGPHDSYSRGVSVAPDGSRVVHFTASGELHVWDLSSDGTQERYAPVNGCDNSLAFELASAALLYQEKSKRSSV
jgi:WD40 repeat protein